jgi:hypothetical protein
MPAAITDKFSKVISGTTRPASTTLAAQKISGAGSCSLVATTGWDTDTAVHGIMYRTDAGTGEKVPGSQIDFKATVSGTTLSDFTVTAGTDDTYEIGTTVELAPTAAWGDDLVAGILVEHDQDGTHGAITTASINNAGALTQTGAATITGALTLKSYDGWINPTDTWTYASATTFTVSGDITATLPVGTKIKLTQTTVKYFYVTGTSYSAPNTTVTVTGGSDYSLANAAITSPAYSYDATPQGFPQWFNYTPSWANFTAGSATVSAEFSMDGKTVNYRIGVTLNGSTMGSNPTYTLPVTSSTNHSTDDVIGQVGILDNGSDDYQGRSRWLTTTTAGLSISNAAGTYITEVGFSSTVPMTWTNNDRFTVNGSYKAA